MSSNAQFGVPRNQEEADVGVDGEVRTAEQQLSDYAAAVAAKLMESAPLMLEQTAVDVAAMIEFAKTDPETSLLLRRMTDGSGAEHFGAFADSMSAAEIATGLVETLNDLKMSDILFKDPERALREMKKEGMLPPDKIKLYEKDPKQLEEDTRKSLYFTFVSLGAAGGYL